MLVAVVSTAGVLALWLLPTILGCGALSIAYCLYLRPPAEGMLYGYAYARGFTQAGSCRQVKELFTVARVC